MTLSHELPIHTLIHTDTHIIAPRNSVQMVPLTLPSYIANIFVLHFSKSDNNSLCAQDFVLPVLEQSSLHGNYFFTSLSSHASDEKSPIDFLLSVPSIFSHLPGTPFLLNDLPPHSPKSNSSQYFL